VEKKHAYLIMAHNELESLKYLLEAIDDERNDIFLHIDKKTSYVDFDEIRTWVNKAGLFFVPRINVRWGHSSFVKCELILLESATKQGRYHYYHFLSGIDYPLKSQDEIHALLQDKNLEYINYHFDGECDDEYAYKIRYYYPLMRWMGRGYHDGPGKKKAILRYITKKQWAHMYKQQQKGVDRRAKYPEIQFVKGDNWVSITDDFARFVISKKNKIMRLSTFANTPDEFFMATLAYNSSFRDRIANDVLRLIDWQRGNPYEFVYTDLQELKHSDKMFARKISYVKEPELVRTLAEHIGVRPISKPATNPLVSIVVPIYNVEKYLEECLESIAAQTYSNIQVLLVDDGSKDGSTKLATDFAARDDRFIYIHQENKGLSGARNTGIENATGEYIAFVDSDDWLEPDYISAMLSVALEKDADITISGLIKENGSKKQIVYDSSFGYSRTAAMNVLDYIFNEKYLMMILAWNKLYKRKLFDNVRYPLGKIHEDEYTIHRLIDKSNLIYTVPKCLYHYRIREDSITGNSLNDDMRHFHLVDAHRDRVQCCRNQIYGDFYGNIVYSMFEEVIDLIRRYSDDAYKKFHLNRKFRMIMLRECIRNYSCLNNRQKKDYLQVLVSPKGYKYKLQRIDAQAKKD
jgi:glycosyltransferase involved in cell wall biosynthesis